MRLLDETTVDPLVPTGYVVAASSIWIAVVLFAVAAFVSVIRTRSVTGLRALIWIGLIVFAPMIGSVAWFLIGRPRERAARRVQS